MKTGVRELFLTLFILSSEKSEVFSSLWLIRIATSIQTNFTVIIGKILSAHQSLEEMIFILTLFNLSSEKSEVFWSLWLIRIVTSIQTVFTLEKISFPSKTGVRELFVTLLLGLLKRVSSLWLKGCNLYTNSFHTNHSKNFSAVFHLKTGVRELFVTLFNWSTKKSEVFASLWLIRSYLYKNSFHSHHWKNFKCI